ncbi:MAG: DUF2075 domain-containing protein, partial [Actinomycetota bacterium]|nr:DUF2075 domain-containing protein [Actinomycetota bacterium]
YNEAVREAQIGLHPCAYLHNYQMADLDDPLRDPVYADYLQEAPAFGKGDVHELRDFICRHIKYADDGQILYHIESGRLRPSKSLQDSLSSMLDGNAEFTMIDDQKVVLETALDLARKAQTADEKHVLIVKGGPGTGKSVVAINLLVRLTGQELVCQYVSKNSAPRNVYSRLLRANSRTKAFIDNLFKGSGGYYKLQPNAFDALVVDEAHRLNEKSGLYANEGENQMRELVDAARFTVFFIDGSQRVTLRDAGQIVDIRRHALDAGATVHETELNSQFRCNGSDSYLEWLDAVLGIDPNGNTTTAFDYDFRVFDDPNELHAAIAQRNAHNNKSRLVAGYCWEWKSAGRGNKNHHDIVIPEHSYARSWNLNSTPTWAIDSNSVHEIGCVHTSQGLEFDYVGVIVGDDMRFENDVVVTDHTRRARTDQSLKGIKKLATSDPVRAQQLADEIIRNTYRVLMTRGLKGCYVFCTDKALAEHLRSLAPSSYATTNLAPMAAEDPLEVCSCSRTSLHASSNSETSVTGSSSTPQRTSRVQS